MSPKMLRRSEPRPAEPWSAMPWLRLTVLALILLLVSVPVTALGQSDASEMGHPVPDGFPQLEQGTVPVPFSVAGPVSADVISLTLLTVKRSCGMEFVDDEALPAAARLVETADSAWFRVDVKAGPDGLPCDHGDLVRVPVTLERPLGDRTIRDARDPKRLPPVNTFDAVDTGLRYHCGWGSCSVADMLGPGLDVSRHGLTPPITNARAVYDSGDYVTWLGEYDPVKRRFACASAQLTDGQWRMHGRNCTPRAVMFDGIDAASWKLRGKRPNPKDQFIRIWVKEEVCNGSPIRPRLQRPVVQVQDFRKGGAIVIVAATTKEPTDPPRRASTSGERFMFVDCPGMAPVKSVVDLPFPIGKRPLLDGGVFPSQERWVKRQ